MTPSPNPAVNPALNNEFLQQSLCRSGTVSRLVVVAQTGSTNSDLAEQAAAEPESWPDRSVLTAEHQTAGRGRLDRRWESPDRAALNVSVLLRPVNSLGRALPLQSYAWFSLLAALALAETLDEHAGVATDIKWPNDLLAGGRKLAGILAQLVPPAAGTAGAAPAVVLGTGLNVSLTTDQLPIPEATSLLLQNARSLDRTALLDAYLRRFARDYGRFCAADGDAAAPGADGTSLLGRLIPRMVTLGQRVRADLPGGEAVRGLAVGLDAGGSLQVRDDAGAVRTVSAGDVVHLRPA